MAGQEREFDEALRKQQEKTSAVKKKSRRIGELMVITLKCTQEKRVSVISDDLVRYCQSGK